MFTRDSQNALIGGVCAGIARALNLNTGAVRVATIVIALLTAILPALLVYCVLWLLTKSE